MNLTRINIGLAVLLLIVATLAAAIDVDYSRPNIEFLPEMKYSPAWEAYAANPNFPNGRTLQAPVRGTIARGELPLHYAATKEDALRAGGELQNPFTLLRDSAAVMDREPGNVGEETQDVQTKRETEFPDRLRASVGRGGQAYAVFCVSCHGAGGAGDGPVTKRGFPPPPPLTTGKSAQMQDGQLLHILTYGQGSMAPMAAQLSRERRWDVINYVRSLQQAAGPSTTLPNEAESDQVSEPEENR